MPERYSSGPMGLSPSRRSVQNPAGGDGERTADGRADLEPSPSCDYFDVITRLGPKRRINGWQETAGLAWITFTAILVLLPVLLHGRTFGEFDALSQFGVLKNHGVVVHNVQAGDQTDSTIAWTSLAWTQVHHGHIPLWNPYAGLGMPLTFAWQAGTFSVPMLISYLLPVSFGPTVLVIFTLLLAGSGCYVFCRLIGLGPLPSALAGTMFQLSGPIIGWLSWIHSSAAAWTGWILVAGVLVLREGHRVRSVVFLAFVIAAMVFAGSPEMLVLMGGAIVIVILVLIATALARTHALGPVKRPVVDLLASGVLGVMLSAPLLLPGMQLISISQRALPGGDPAEQVPGNPPLPPENLTHLFFQGFDGLPIAGNHWFGYILGYSETAFYIGVIGVVLAVAAAVVKWKNPMVMALGVMTIAAFAAAFFPPVVSILGRLPAIGTVVWQRAVFPAAFGLALLAAIGLHCILTESSKQRRAILCSLWGFGATSLVLLLLLLFDTGGLTSADHTTRLQSFIWPLCLTVLGLSVSLALLIYQRRRQSHRDGSSLHISFVAGLLLVAGESAFLIAAGLPLWTSSNTFYAPTGQEAALKHTVGNSLVGFGAELCFYPPGLGIIPNAQAAYDIRELGIYDPMIPSAYFSTWKTLTNTTAGNPNDSLYCPAIQTVKEARLYGVGFVLEPKGSQGPAGSEFVRTIGDESVYRIPHAGTAVLVTTPGGSNPGPGTTGTIEEVNDSDPSNWSLRTNSRSAGDLRLRIVDVPGWHVEVDGRAVPIKKFAGLMMSVAIPPGSHEVRISYWPMRFTEGLVLAAIAVLIVISACAVAIYRRTRPPRDAFHS